MRTNLNDESAAEDDEENVINEELKWFSAPDNGFDTRTTRQVHDSR